MKSHSNCCLLNWILSKHPRDREPKDEAGKLALSIRVTSKCRFNASIHLRHRGRFSFFTTTFLSLGLIFIPLMQNSGINLHFSSGILNTMQTFLAVAILVYSVIIGTAQYELRAEKLNSCGVKLKQLTREIERELENQNDNRSQILKDYLEKYYEVIEHTENHSRTDYRLAMLEMKNDYHITGIPRVKEYILAYCSRTVSYALPIFMIVIELVFILDMIGITEILRPYIR